MEKQITIKGTSKPGRQKQYKNAAAKQLAYRRRREVNSTNKTIQITLNLNEFYALERIAKRNSVTKSKVVGKMIIGVDKKISEGMTDTQFDEYYS